VTAGFRAEDVRLVGETRPDQLFRGIVQLVEPIGSDTFVEVEVGESMIVARVPPDASVQIGEVVDLEVALGGVHLFERAGGSRISR
jgi:multiple sugar transport system ATP-binding protein